MVEAEDDGVLPLIARLASDPMRLFLKTGRVGATGRGSLPITRADRDAALAAATSPGAEWELDPDFEVEILASGAPGVEEGLFVPRFLYRRADRFYEYAAAIPEAKKRLAEHVETR